MHPNVGEGDTAENANVSRFEAVYACLDIGTNSVILLLSGLDKEKVLCEISESFRSTRLGAGLERTRSLSDKAVERTLVTVDQFVHLAQTSSHRPLHWAVACTSAVREATNGAAFLDRCREVCGCTPRVLTGREEAECIFAGAGSSLAADREFITVDIGGGSTEIGYGTPVDCRFAASLPIGCVRYTERFGLCHHAEPEAVTAARGAAAAAFSPVATQLRLEMKGSHCAVVRLSGGTATTFAALARDLESYNRERVEGYVCSLADIERMTRKMCALSFGSRRRIPVLEAGRARILPAGLIILSECMKSLRAQEISVTTRGLRFGMARKMALGEWAPMMISS